MKPEDLTSHINNPESLNKETLPEIKILTEKYPFFQSAWMLYLKNLKLINHPDFKTELQRIAIRILDRKKLFKFLNNNNKKLNFSHSLIFNHETSDIPVNNYQIEDTEIPKAKAENKDLITSFITSQPDIRINKKRNEDIPKGDYSEESILVSDEIITETFANILVQQKKYGNAIKAFEKLSLKFPEKSIYFADRIEEIKKLVNN